MLGSLEGFILSTFVGCRLGELDGSSLDSKDSEDVVGDPDVAILGMAVGALLGYLEVLLLSTNVGLRLGAPDGSLLGSEGVPEGSLEVEGFRDCSDEGVPEGALEFSSVLNAMTESIKGLAVNAAPTASNT